MKIEKKVMRLLGSAIVACICVVTAAHAVSPNAKSALQPIAAQGGPAMPLETLTDLKFGDFFASPVGPEGLKPTDKLLGLNGHRVRIVGYLAEMDEPVADLCYLTPYQVVLSHEDEPLADNLPPSTLFVHSGALGKSIPRLGGLVRLTGRLAVGASEEPDGRISAVRLSLDRESLDSLFSTSLARRKDSHGPEKRERP